jgi:O-6-methylguanine DNA methyltransferase
MGQKLLKKEHTGTVIERLYSQPYISPIGVLELSCIDEGLVAITLCETDKNSLSGSDDSSSMPGNSKNHPILIQAVNELDQYFAGEREVFDVPIKIIGTEFQVKIWRALYAIPYGTVKTYGQIASEVGNKEASRAVGMACKKNPLLIVVPCHRVIGANNKLTGFNIGLDKKKVLLRHEKIDFEDET